MKCPIKYANNRYRKKTTGTEKKITFKNMHEM